MSWASRSAAASPAQAPPAAAAARYPASASAADRGQRYQSLMGLQTEAEQLFLQRGVVGQHGHRAAMNDAAIVHHQHIVADLLGNMEILLDQQDSDAAALDFGETFDEGADDGR